MAMIKRQAASANQILAVERMRIISRLFYLKQGLDSIYSDKQGLHSIYSEKQGLNSIMRRNKGKSLMVARIELIHL